MRAAWSLPILEGLDPYLPDPAAVGVSTRLPTLKSEEPLFRKIADYARIEGRSQCPVEPSCSRLRQPDPPERRGTLAVSEVTGSVGHGTMSTT